MSEGKEGGMPVHTIEVKAKGTVVYEVVKLPTDANLLALFGKWADAWGERSWEQKAHGLESEEVDTLGNIEGDAEGALKAALVTKGYKDIRFVDGTVFFDDGHVQLTHR